MQPPALHSAEYHQAGQKEADKKSFLEDKGTLVALIGLREAQEHQEQPEEGDRMVREHHDPCEQHQVRHDYGSRDACFGRSAIGRCPLQMLAKCEGGNGGVRKDSQCSLPAKGGEHESAVPLPGRSDHQHRWGGVGSQGPTDRHVDEQHAQSEVFHCFGYLRSEDLWREHQCRNGHGRWLRDQRSQKWDGSQPEPCGRDRSR
ncbi:hypothetical protein D9M72_475590 [compost metagenome]